MSVPCAELRTARQSATLPVLWDTTMSIQPKRANCQPVLLPVKRHMSAHAVLLHTRRMFRLRVIHIKRTKAPTLAQRTASRIGFVWSVKTVIRRMWAQQVTNGFCRKKPVQRRPMYVLTNSAYCSRTELIKQPALQLTETSTPDFRQRLSGRRTAIMLQDMTAIQLMNIT